MLPQHLVYDLTASRFKVKLTSKRSKQTSTDHWNFPTNKQTLIVVSSILLSRMKSIIALLLAIPLIWARVRDPSDVTDTTAAPDTRVCYKGAARVAFSEENDRTQYDARARIETCPSSEYGCGGIIHHLFIYTQIRPYKLCIY